MNRPVLDDYLNVACEDVRLNMPHLCIYIALIQSWNKNQFQNPVRIKRIEIMRLAKIKAKTTYHKSIKALEESRYIKYEPSYNPRGSFIYILDLHSY